MSFNVAGFVMKPQIVLSQKRDGKISSWKPSCRADLINSARYMQLLIGIRVPLVTVSMNHAGWRCLMRENWNRPKQDNWNKHNRIRIAIPSIHQSRPRLPLQHHQSRDYDPAWDPYMTGQNVCGVAKVEKGQGPNFTWFLTTMPGLLSKAIQ